MPSLHVVAPRTLLAGSVHDSPATVTVAAMTVSADILRRVNTTVWPDTLTLKTITVTRSG